MDPQAQARPDVGARVPIIRLDKSKPYTTVHGERTPDDPLYRVHFRQDDLPFDVQGVLVPDDGKRETWRGKDVDDKQVTYHPLYNDAMRAKVARKAERIAKGMAAMEDVLKQEEAEDAERRADVEECNLVGWLKGDVHYEPELVYAAVKSRYGKAMRSIRDVIEFLVIDGTPPLVPEDDVQPRLMETFYANRRAA